MSTSIFDDPVLRDAERTLTEGRKGWRGALVHLATARYLTEPENLDDVNKWIRRWVEAHAHTRREHPPERHYVDVVADAEIGARQRLIGAAAVDSIRQELATGRVVPPPLDSCGSYVIEDIVSLYPEGSHMDLGLRMGPPFLARIGVELFREGQLSPSAPMFRYQRLWKYADEVKGEADASGLRRLTGRHFPCVSYEGLVHAARQQLQSEFHAMEPFTSFYNERHPAGERDLVDVMRLAMVNFEALEWAARYAEGHANGALGLPRSTSEKWRRSWESKNNQGRSENDDEYVRFIPHLVETGEVIDTPSGSIPRLAFYTLDKPPQILNDCSGRQSHGSLDERRTLDDLGPLHEVFVRLGLTRESEPPPARASGIRLQFAAIAMKVEPFISWRGFTRSPEWASVFAVPPVLPVTTDERPMSVEPR